MTIHVIKKGESLCNKLARIATENKTDNTILNIRA